MKLTEQPEKLKPEEDTSLAVDMLTQEEIEQAYSAQPTKEEFDTQIQTEENPVWNGTETKPCPPTYVTSPQK